MSRLNLKMINRHRWAIVTALLLTLLTLRWITDRRTGQLVKQGLPTVQQIELLSTLTTVRIQIADVCETELNGRTGGESVLLVVRGSATVGVDLSKATFLQVDVCKREARVELPQPDVQTVTLDHARSRIVALRTSGLWMIVPGEGAVDAIVVQEGYRRGERLIDVAAHDPAVIERAQEQAKNLLDDFYRTVGWNVAFEWRHS